MNRSVFDKVTMYRMLGYIVRIWKEHLSHGFLIFILTKTDFSNKVDRKHFRCLFFQSLFESF